MKPVLKWVGGKTQILDEVLSLFPREIENYHEPFAGGGSVFLGMLNEIRNKNIKVTGGIFISDLNADLIMFYKTIQNSPEVLHKEIVQVFMEYDSLPTTEKSIENRKPLSKDDALKSKESYYYWSRKVYNSLASEDDVIKKAALFLFLNKTCFRGIHREGPNGFNVPYGNYKKTPQYPQLEYINEMSKLFEKVTFQCQDFQTSLGNVKNGDFVYMDPPYLPLDSKSFTSYTSDGFSENQHNELFTIIQNMNNSFVMSNAATSYIYSQFSYFKIIEIECRRAIHSKNPGATAKEVLVTNIL